MVSVNHILLGSNDPFLELVRSKIFCCCCSFKATGGCRKNKNKIYLQDVFKQNAFMTFL